ncbi:MAG: methionine synthase [Alphaproteobacteria bacterium]|nr:methionine synthase [Alphaproteobacteria bacterium]
MLTSERRILTTHVGSLPRVEGLADLIVAREQKQPVDPAAYAATLERALKRVVERQIEAGIDIGNDGEMPRPNFASYIAERMTGFGSGGRLRRPIPLDAKHFPIWFENVNKSGRRRLDVFGWPQAMGEIHYGDMSGVAAECDGFERQMATRPGAFAETFMTAVSPGFAACTLMNNYYAKHEDYVFALARELKKEYDYIVGRGFVLQIDAPDMGMERGGFYQEKTLPEFLAAIEMHIAALNLAIADIPADRVRLHSCWGNRDSPHAFDVPCPDILPVLYQAKVGALVLPFANPRHAHEIEAFRRLKLPDAMALVVGVIETTGNYVEHPELVAERLIRAAACVGDRSRVIAGTDCGFGTIAGDTFTTEDVVWAKLKTLTEGATIASRRLWG